MWSCDLVCDCVIFTCSQVILYVIMWSVVSYRVICFESEAVHSQVRSLWRVELTKIRWACGLYMDGASNSAPIGLVANSQSGVSRFDWDMLLPVTFYMLVNHYLTVALSVGGYLGTSEENDKLTLLPSNEAKLANTLFRFRQSLVSLLLCLNYSNRAVTCIPYKNRCWQI